MNTSLKTLVFLFILLAFASSNVGFATDIATVCAGTGGSPEAYDTPPLTQILCSGIRILNFGFLLIGSVFVIMFTFGMYKYATAWGDPKGIQGAQQTVVHAILGAIVCFGAATIMLVIGNVFGLQASFSEGANPFDKLLEGYCDLLDVADVDCQGNPRY